MITSLQSYVRKAKHYFRRLALNPQFHHATQVACFFLAGFVFSAAGLGNYCTSLAVGVVCALGVWPGILAALGGMLGYWVFWGQAGYIGIFSIVFALPFALCLGDQKPLGKPHCCCL